MQTWPRFVVSGLAIAVFTLSCGSDDSDPTADTGPIDQACADVAAARCGAMQRCAPALFTFEYGTMESCSSQYGAWCNHVGKLPGSKVGPKALGSCATTYSSMSCETWQSRRDDLLCDVGGGSLPVEATCVSGYQCSSKACFLDSEGACGTCQPAPTLGEACRLSMECPSNASCIGYKCVEAMGIGQPCDASKPCAGTLLCSGGTCAMSPSPGQPCLEGVCNNRLATACEGGTCEALSMVGDGQACNAVSGPFCGGGTCTTQGVCAAPVPEGRPCSTTAGPACLMPGVCLAGWCKIPDPSTCP